VDVGVACAEPKLLRSAAKLIEVCDKNIDVPKRRHSLASSLASHLLGGETAGYQGPRLPRMKMYLYCARQCFLQSVRLLQGETSTLARVHAELTGLCSRPLEDEQYDESLIYAWKRVTPEIRKAAYALTRAKFHHRQACANHVELEDPKEELDDLSQQTTFILHRAFGICKLVEAANKQREILLHSEQFEMEGAFEVVDKWREAMSVADSLDNSGINVDGVEDVAKNPDVELLCISMHFLAKMFSTMSFKGKAKDMHISVLRTGLSLDPGSSGIDEATEVLTSKAWWIESNRFVEQAQKDVVEAKEKERLEALKEIETEIQALQKARNLGSKPNAEDEDPRPLLKHLLSKHPSKTDVDVSLVEKVNGVEAIKKTHFMKFMTFYHPDKLNAFYQPAVPPRKEKLLFEEIQKLLNNIYEKNWKS